MLLSLHAGGIMHFKINYRNIPAISSCENLISSGVGLLALRPSFGKKKKKKEVPV